MAKQSEWMRGLLNAEKLHQKGMSLEHIQKIVENHSFGAMDDYDKGHLDYCRYKRSVIPLSHGELVEVLR